MGRLTDLFKSFVPPKDEVKTPSFIKPEHSKTPSDNSHQVTAPTAPPQVKPDVHNSKRLDNSQEKAGFGNQVQGDKIDVPVYQSDSEWDVVQRSINLFADNANLSQEVKQAFVKKWVTEMAKAEQTMLYRSDEDNSEHHGHLGNEINRADANLTTGLLGTYQAMLHPGRQARMTDELKALQCVEKTDFTILDPQLCRNVKIDLVTTVIGTMDEQKTAAQKLIQKVQKGQPEADKIYLVVKAVANCREMRLNSAIKTAILKMDALKYQQFGLQSSEPDSTVNVEEPLVLSQESSAEQAESRPNFKTDVNKIVKSKKTESAWVDEQALKLFGK